MDASFSFEEQKPNSVIIESRDKQRNTKYSKGLLLLLERLRDHNLKIQEISLYSRVAISQNENGIPYELEEFTYPIDIRSSNLENLKSAIQSKNRSTLQADGAKGGNSEKRIKIQLKTTTSHQELKCILKHQKLPDLSEFKIKLEQIAQNIPEDLTIPKEIWEFTGGDESSASLNLTPNGLIRFRTSRASEHELGHNILIKISYASFFLRALLSYRDKIGEFFSIHDINNEKDEYLEASSNGTMPESWARIEASISEDDILSETQKEDLKRFVTDGQWSGITKGIGRKTDFFNAPVVNAIGGNVTHNTSWAQLSKITSRK